MRLELFTSGACHRCRQAEALLRDLIGESGLAGLELQVLDVVRHLDRAVAAGVVATPALVAEGRVLCAPLPRRRKLRELLLEAMGGD